MSVKKSFIYSLCIFFYFALFVSAQVPTAEFDGTPRHGLAPVNVQFTDQSTGFIQGRLWNFGDGTTSTAQNPAYSYTDPGAYIVSLTAINYLGNNTEVKPDFIRVDQEGSHIWNDEWIEWVGNTGPYSSIALNASGYPVIAYCFGIVGEGSNSAKYAEFDGTDWNIEVVNDDADVGPYISLVFDSTGTPHVAYYNFADGNLEYARRNGSTWSLEMVDNDVDDVGLYASIALNTNDLPRISYYDADDGDLLYAEFDGVNWSNEVAVSDDDVGKYSSLVLNSNGMPQIVYYNATDSSLQISTFDDDIGFWVTDTIDNDGDVGRYCRQAITYDGIPLICYYDATLGNLKFAIWEPITSQWRTTTIDATGNVGEYCDLALDSSGDPHITYYDRSNGAMKYAEYNRTLRNWSIEDAAKWGGADLGQYSTVVVGNDGVIHAACYDTSTDGLSYFSGQSTNPPIAEFQGGPTNDFAPLTVQFVSMASGVVTDRLWLFGDGSSSTVENPSHIYSTAGVYTVEYQVENDNGSDAVEKIGFIKALDPSLDADFMTIPSTGVVSLTVLFTNTTTGVVQGQLWSFGDGESSTNVMPSHTYTNVGTYTVSLTVTNKINTDSKVKTNVIEVLEHIAASFSGAPLLGATPLAVQFTNESSGPFTYSTWDFGDGESGVTVNPLHTYTNAGTFSVSLTVSNAFDMDVSTMVDYVTVQEAVVADFTATPTEGVVALAVQFTNESSGPFTNILWDFGDGATSTTENPVHIYNNIGDYTVSLTVSNAYSSDMKVQTAYVSVLDHVVADFTAGPTVGEAPLMVSFTNESTGPVTGWLWDFGDGNTSVLQAPSHLYSTAGVYTVKLDVSNAYESSSITRTNYVKALDMPVAAFDTTPQRGARPLSVQFSDTSTGSIDSWLWTFGDGHTSTNQNPLHSYTNIGLFTVSLTVSNELMSDVYTETDMILTYDETYVSFDGSHTWPYKSWATAAHDIQSAVSAQTYGGTVWVSNGTYNTGSTIIYGSTHNRVALTNAVQLLSLNGPAATVIEGQLRDWQKTPRAIRGVYVGNDSLLSGFTIKSGGVDFSGDDIHEQSGGGAWCEPDGVISNCIITEGGSEQYGAGVYGGRIYNSELYGNGGSEAKYGGAAARAILVDCEIYNNQGYWGTIYGGTNIRCTISGNVAVYGGGTYESRSIDCKIIDNASYTGGGTWWGSLENCLVSHNLAKESGGSYGLGGGCYQGALVNCTVVDNDAQVIGGGVYNSSVENSIIYFNTASNSNPNYIAGTIQYSCTTPLATGSSNIISDPLFVNRISANYHLTASSPCIDSGTDSGLTNDLDQFIRPYDGDNNGTAIYDMGAYEFWDGAQQIVDAQFSADKRQITPGTSIQFTDESTGPIVSWSWSFGDGGTSGNQNPSHIYAADGVYTVSLTVNGQASSNTVTKINYIYVRTGIVVDFTGAPTETDQTYLSVQFTNLTTGVVDGWHWNFGDYSTSTEKNPSHYYNTNGSYTVTLTASNVAETVVLTRDEYICINTPMSADFEVNKTNGISPLTVQFWTHSSGPRKYWFYDFGDGDTTWVQNPAHTYTNPGIYTVVHTVSNDYRSASITKTNLIEVLGPIAARFSASPTNGVAPLAVQFIDESTGPVAYWLWQFGDGQESVTSDPLHIYSTPGTYSVVLVVSNAFDTSILTKTNIITVLQDPLIAEFSGQPLIGPVPLVTVFTNQSSGPYTHSVWEFGDGASSVLEHPSHAYTNAGVYSVSLTVSNSYDSSVISKTGYVEVKEKLSSWFTASPATGTVSLAVQFTDQSMGSATHWAWDFGDGESSLVQNPLHTYTNAGVYSVSLVVSNALDVDQVVRTNIVTVIEPVLASFSALLRNGPAPLSVTFTNESTGPVTGQLWSFGDGTISVDENPTHIYTNQGAYTVSLTVSNAYDDDIHEAVDYVNVRTALHADFSASSTAGDPPLTVTFTDLSTGLVEGRLWSFGDGDTDAGANPVHTYTNEGSYTVSLTVTNEDETVTLVRTNYITLQVLDPDFIAVPRQGLFPLSVQFTNRTTGATIGQEWFFGDGTVSTEENPLHTYQRRGAFDVTLTTSNALFSREEHKSGFIQAYENSVPGWQLEKVDVSGVVGLYGSLAIDSSGHPHISYRDHSADALKYATFDGADWKITTIAYGNTEGIFTSLALTASGTPAISRYCYGDRTLKYSWLNGTSWQTETVDDINDTGVYSSLAFGTDGYPCISYYDQTDSALRFAKYDGSDWQTETVDNNGAAGLYTSLTIDTNGLPHISYVADNMIRYAVFNGTEWVVETVSGTENTQFTSLVLDSHSRPVIALYDGVNGDLKLAMRQNGVWEINLVDAVPAIGNYCSIELNSIDAPRIAYYDASNKQLKYAVYLRGAWSIESVDVGPNVGEYASLAMDTAGRPGISYYDAGQQDLNFAYNTALPLVDALITVSPLGGPAPLEVQFSGRTAGTVTHSVWNFGDGYTSTDENPIHVYTNEGLYAATFTVSNSVSGDTYTRAENIIVSDLVVDFDASPTIGLRPLEVAFTNLTTGYVEQLQWDFGDGEYSTETNPVHTYVSAGNYTVQLLAMNSFQANSTTKTNLISALSIDARFSSVYRFGPASLTVAFTNESVGPYTAQMWSFGDGATSYEQSPVHTYTSDGEYTVSLTVLASGQTSMHTKQDYVYVGDITAEFSVVPVVGPAPLEVSMTNLSTGPIISYLWEFGDGNQSTNVTPLHTYSTEGTYDVTLSVRNHFETQLVTHADAVVVLGQRKPKWQTSTVNNVAGGGEYCSLVLTTNDYPLISYYGNRNLELAEFNGTNFQITTVDANEFSGKYTSLALDSSGYPAISYYSHYQDLNYTVFNGIDWITQIVASDGMVGLDTSLAFDPAGHPLISYVKVMLDPWGGGRDDDLYLAQHNGSVWMIEKIDEAGNIGHNSSLALDVSGNPRIAYSGDGEVRYSAYNGSSWDASAVLTTSSWKNYTSLSLDTAFNPVISFYDYAEEALKLAYFNGIHWDVEYIDTIGHGSGFTSLEMFGDLPRVSYYDCISHDLKYAEYDGSIWKIETIDNVGNVGQYSSLALNSHGQPCISYYDVTHDQLKYITFTQLAADFVADIRGGKAPLDVQFVDLSGGIVSSRTWDFGDGLISHDEHPKHTYSSNGLYTVTLSVEDEFETNILTRVGYIEVLDLHADFTANQTSGGNPLTVAFSDLSKGYKIQSWLWDFGDGGISTNQNPTHTYTNSGSYDVLLTVTNYQESHTIGRQDYIDVATNGWMRTVVDSRGDSGWYSSLELNERVPHIAYYDATNSVTRYATYNGAAWTNENIGTTSGLDGHTSLKLRPDGLPAIVYYGSPGTGSTYYYGLRSNGVWSVEDTSLGGWGPSSFDFDSMGLARMAFAGSSYWLNFGTRASGGGWSESTVVAGDAARHISFSIAAEKYNISYYDATSGHLMYKYFSGGQWWSETVDSSNSVGTYNSMEFYNGRPHISYYDAANGALKYAVRGSLGWNLETVDNAGDVGKYSSLELDDRGYPRICYYDQDNQNLKYAAFDGQNWIVVDLDNSGSVGKWCSLDLDPLGNPAVAYYDADAKALRYMAAEFSPFGFMATPNRGDPPLDVSFESHSVEATDNWLWDFGDGTANTNKNPDHTYTNIGIYTVVLSADVGGVATTITNTDYIIVNDLVADFTASQLGGITPLTVMFSNESSGTILGQVWSFGDGTSSTNVNPQHIYTNGGVFTVTLTVSNAYGSVFSKRVDYIQAAGPLTPSFSVTPELGVVPLGVQFTDDTTGAPDGWLWNFGDGSVSTNQNPSHTYTNGDIHTVTLAVSNVFESVSTTATDVVTAEIPLVVDFGIEPKKGAAPLTVQFTDQSQGPVNYWKWSFGDGSGSYQQNPLNTYQNPGTYSVSLEVHSSAQNVQTTKVACVEVYELSADFSADPARGSSPLMVSFADQSGGTVESWLWDLGDGSTSTNENPLHTYTNYGIYDVSLQVVGGGQTDTVTRTAYIRVEDLEAIYKATPRIGSAPLDVTFTNYAKGNVQSVLWDFGDGVTSTDTNPVHQYTSDGDYNVSLTVWDYVDSHTLVMTNYIKIGDLDMNWTKWTIDDDAGDDSSLAVDVQDHAHIAYGSSRYVQNMKYVFINGTSWTPQVIDTNAHSACSLALDNSSYPHVAYAHKINDYTSELYYAVSDGSNWQTEVVFDDDTFHPYRMELALDNNNKEWLSFYAGNNFKVASKEGGLWQTSIPSGSSFSSLSMAMAPTEYPAVIYEVGIQSYYNIYDGIHWNNEQLPVSYHDAGNGDLKYDYNGYPVIAYASWFKLKMLRFDGTDWVGEEVDSEPIFRGVPSVAVGPYGNIGVAYITTNNQLRFAIEHGTGWHVETIALVDSHWGRTPSLDFDSHGYAHISYIDEGELKYIFNSDVVQALFDAAPIAGSAPLSVQFTNQSAGAVSSWLWNFGDDDTSPAASPSHTYMTDGVYTVSLTVGDGIKTDTMTLTNLVAVGDFGAWFTASPTNGGPGLTVQFMNQSTGTVDSFFWEFGDGETSTNENPVHIYTNQFNGWYPYYDVALTISNSWQSDTIVRGKLIRIDPVYADFSVGISTGAPPLTVSFSNLSMGHTNAVWNFGDYIGDRAAVNSMETDVNHTYRFIGSYDFTLQVDNGTDYDWAGSNNLVEVYNPEWDIETVQSGVLGDYEQHIRLAQNGSGHKLISYVNGGTLWLATHNGSGWTTEPIASGVSSHHDLAITPDGILVVCYREDSSHKLMYAYKSTGSWVSMHVGGYLGEYSSPSISVDVNGNPWIAWHDVNGKGLYVADYRFDGTNWLWHLDSVDNSLYAGAGARIDIAPNGMVGVLYSRDGAMRFASRKYLDGEWDWDVSIIDINSGYGGFNSFLFDGNSMPHVARFDYNAGVLKYALFNGMSWNITTVDAEGETGRACDLALTTEGKPSIAYAISHDHTASGWPGYDLKYAWYSGSQWHTEHIDGLSACGRVGLRILDDGHPAVAYVSTTGLCYAVCNRAVELTASFRSSVRGGRPPLPVTFTDQSYGDILSYSWSFGDLGSSSDASPTHIYNEVGEYTVALTVTDDDGSDMFMITNCIVVEELTAGFSADVTEGMVPLQVQFTNTSSISADTWDWDFGDNQTSKLRDPVHLYTSTGTYSVVLVASSDWASDTNRLVNYIVVTNVPPPPPLEVKNVRAEQRVGTKLVDIYFDLSYTSNGTLNVDIDASADGGSSFGVTIDSLDGHGYNKYLRAGANRSVVWNAGKDFGGQDEPDMVFRVKVDDGTLNSEADSDDVAINTIVTGPPVVQEVQSTDCNAKKHVYYLNGVSLDAEFWVTIDWNGHTPDEIVWNVAGTEHGGLITARDLNVGTAFGVGGKLVVTAISADGTVSKPFTANFDVIDLPIGFDASLFDVLSGDPLRYQLAGSVLSLIDAGIAKVPKDDNGNALYGFTDMAMKFTTDIITLFTINGDGTALAHKFTLYENSSEMGGVTLEPKLSGSIKLAYQPSSGDWMPTGNIKVDLKAGGESPEYRVWGVIYIKGKYDITGGVDFQLVSWATPTNPVFNGELPVIAGAEFVIGAGSGWVVSIEAYIRATGFFTAQYPNEPHLKTLGVGLEGGGRITSIAYQKTLAKISTNWYSVGGPSEPAPPALIALMAGMGSGSTDFVPLSRDYTYQSNHDYFIDTNIDRDLGFSISIQDDPPVPRYKEAELIVDNVYPFANPVISATGTNRILCWLHDDTARISENRTELISSSWDGSSWELPVAVWDDGTSDFMPDALVLSNGTEVVVWANGRGILSAGATYGDSMTNLEIAVATRMGSNSTWSSFNLTTNSIVDHSPLISAGTNSHLLLTWVQNMYTNLTGSTTEPNTLLYSLWDGGTGWISPSQAVSGIGMMLWGDLAFNGSNGLFVAAIDGDDDSVTREDVELYATTFDGVNWGTWSRLTTDNINDTCPRIAYGSNGELIFVWLRDGVLVSSDSLDLQSPITIIDPGTNSSIQEIELTLGAQGQITVLWVATPSGGSGRPEPMIAHYDKLTQSWSDPIQLLKNDDLERAFSGTYASENHLLLAFDSVDLSTNGEGNVIFGETDLMLLDYEIGYDVTVVSNSLCCLPEVPVPGDAVNLSVDVCNIAALAGTNVMVRFYFGDPEAGGIQIDTNCIIPMLRAGACTNVSVVWNVPTNDLHHAVYAVVDPDLSILDMNRENNKESKTFLLPDLDFAGIYVEQSISDAKILNATVANTGTAPSVSSAQIRFIRGSTNGILLGAVSISGLDTGKQYDASIAWDLSAETFTSAYEYVYVEIDRPNTVIELDEKNNVTLIRVVTTLDSDSDGLFDGDEERFGTDPHLADTDGDGLSDYTEVILLRTDPLKKDSDGDGMDDGDEVIAGTGPLDVLSVLRLDMIWRQDINSLVLRWPSVSNRIYTLRHGDNLLIPFGTNAILPANPPENRYTNPVGGIPRGFYQIEVKQE